MKKNKENIGILALGLIWIGGRIVIAKTISSETAFQAGAFANLLFLLLVIYWALRDTYGTRLPADSHFLVDLKNTLRAGSKYVVLATALILVNYLFLDPDYMTDKVEAQMNASRDWLMAEGNHATLIAENPQLEGKTIEELLAMKQEQAELFNSPHTQTLFSLLALMFMCVFYSIVLVLLFRKVLYRQKKVYPQENT